MSQRPPASGPSSEHPHSASQGPQSPSSASAATLRHVLRRTAGSAENEPTGITYAGGRSTSQHFQPGFIHGASTASEQSSTRLLGVHSILNPSQSDPSDDVSRIQSSIKFESPSSTVSSVPRYSLSSAPPSPSLTSLGHYPPSPGDGLARMPRPASRRILTPKSPARSLVPSLHPIQPATATINASEAPFAPARGPVYSPEARSRPPESTSNVPGQSTSRAPFGYPPAAVASSTPFHDRRASGGASHTGHSQSASPSPSHASFPQYPPAPSYLQAPQSVTQYPGSLPSTSSYSGPTPLAMMYGSQMESANLPQGSSLQMTFNTESGPLHVPVTVDMQHASKLADEKRKRNAGASARFRQRRKEKEREASETIAKLEQEIRDLAEDRDYYRGERNFFRDMLSRMQTAIPPRPQSPVHRRPPPGELSAAQGGSWQHSDEQGGQGRNTRRRTSGYQSSYESSSPPATLPPIPNVYRPPAPLQPSFSDPRAPPVSGSQPLPHTQTTLPPPSRTPSYDPYRRDPYDRSWNPAP